MPSARPAVGFAFSARLPIFDPCVPVMSSGKAGPRLPEGKLMLRAIVIASAIGLAAPSYAQVKVITGDVEHVYGPGGEILDSPELRAKNQREMRGEERPATLPEQQSLSVQQSGPSRAPNSWWRYQPPTSWWNNNGYTPPKSAWSQ